MTELTLRNQADEARNSLEQQRDSVAQSIEHQRVQLLNERFSVAADKLGHDQPATRMAGAYAMAALADEWDGQRQMCIDVLCAYLRLPYEPDRSAAGYREGEREVRRTIIRIIRNHLRPGYTPVEWCTYNFHLEGVVFDCGDLSNTQFTGGHTSFHAAKFVSDVFHFTGARVDGAHLWFTKANFAADVKFDGAQFQTGRLSFKDASHSSGEVTFLNVTSGPGCAIDWGPFTSAAPANGSGAHPVQPT